MEVMETTMAAPFKTRLTDAQAVELILAGVEPSRRVGDGWKQVFALPEQLVGDPRFDRPRGKFIPIFTLEDLMSMLPKPTERERNLRMWVSGGKYYTAYYEFVHEGEKKICRPMGSPKGHAQMADSLYEFLLWAARANMLYSRHRNPTTDQIIIENVR